MAPERGPQEPKPKQKTEVLPETEGEISLQNLLTYDNPNLPRYKELIKQEHEETGRVWLPQTFSEEWADMYFDRRKEGNKKYNPDRKDLEKQRAFFKEKLQGEILIDIGGGQGRTMPEFAKKFGARLYINVDEHHGELEGAPNPQVGKPAKIDYWRLPKSERTRPMEAIDVKADMLDFVARLPDNSCNFVVNGINMEVIISDDYREALIEELMRATKVGGIMFGITSDIWRKSDPRFKNVAGKLELDTEGWGNEHTVFEKIKE
jgi:hypothetical protein